VVLQLSCYRVIDIFAGVSFPEALKLKYHRLKPGGVDNNAGAVSIAVKLKYHRLKPGGV